MPAGTESSDRTWFVTGASRGLGRAIAEAALDRGDRVVATARDPRSLDALRDGKAGRLEVLRLDVRDRAAVQSAVEEGAARFGGMDVVVNNAGVGHVGMLEEVTEREAVDHLSVNLLGAIWVTQAALPHLRRGGGDVVQVSSTGGVGSMPGLGLYNAGKWALEGWSEALAAEVASFGVRVTILEPSELATDWAGSSMGFSSPISVYDGLREEVFGTATVPWPVQPDAEPSGDPPQRVAHALLDHLYRQERPLRLIVGTGAVAQVGQVLAARHAELRENAEAHRPA